MTLLLIGLHRWHGCFAIHESLGWMGLGFCILMFWFGGYSVSVCGFGGWFPTGTMPAARGAENMDGHLHPSRITDEHCVAPTCRNGPMRCPKRKKILPHTGRDCWNQAGGM